jgi:UDP-N-acetylmuramoylalanine--D-glutamate ligase
LVAFAVRTPMESGLQNSYNVVAMKIEITPPVAILGFGVEGHSAFDYLKKHGIKNIKVLDEKEDPDAFKDLTKFNTIIRSPGVYYKRTEIKDAEYSGAVITSMTELTLELAKKRITAISGSNGKTTTTALVGEILKKHYDGKVIVGGNDRKPVLQEAEDRPDWPIVMEVSSFQFADIHTSSHIAAILNITPNHLDWHEDLEDYINAKNNVIKHQTKNDWAVLNVNNEDSAKLAEDASAQIFWIGEKKGDNWADWKNDNIVVNGETIINIKDIKVKTHPDNLLFSAAIAKLHNVPNQTIIDAMKEFSGVEHRLEFVRMVNGIHFYNDSSCTTPESAEVAIDQFPHDKLILLLGGSSKHSHFSFLVSKILNNKIRVYLYGQEGRKINKELTEIGGKDLIINYNESKDFEEIIKDAFVNAKSGDDIVLSPACASFDMFKNSKDRGNQFKDIINKL